MAQLIRKLSRKRSSKSDPKLEEALQQKPIQYSVEVDGNPVVRRSTLSETLISTFYDDVTTVYEGFLRGCKIAGDRPCLGRRGQKSLAYQWLTYNEVHEKAKNFGSGLVQLGCSPTQASHIGIHAQNCVEWVVTDLACHMFSMMTIPIYDTHGPEACVFIIDHAKIDVIVCHATKVPFLLENKHRLHDLRLIVKMGELPTEEERVSAKEKGVKIICFSEVEELGKHNREEEKPAKPEDVFTISYTSGTTGTPKGVIQTHANMIADVSGVMRHFKSVGYELNSSDRHISFLPLAHAYERIVHAYLFQAGAQIGFFRGDVRLLAEDMQELKPTIFNTVPRLLNKVYDKVMAQVSESKFKSWLFEKALKAKEADLNKNILRGDTIWDKVVFKKVQMLFGGQVRAMSSGAAPLSAKVMTFFKCAMGDCKIMEGYGQTECTAVCTVQFPNDLSAGHVGGPLPNNLIKLIDVPEKNYYTADSKGEVCIKGPNVSQGYYTLPEKTAETFDEDGWLHTGDIGMFLKNGALKIIDRRKDIFKLAQGEYIAPAKVEEIVTRSPFVAQAYVHGESLKTYVIAIVVPDQEVLEKWAKQKGIEGDFKMLCQKEVVRKEIFEDIMKLCREAKLMSFEQVKAIHLHPELFSVDNGLLTATFKTKRPACLQEFQEQIKEVFAEIDARGLRSKSEMEVNLEIDKAKLENANE